MKFTRTIIVISLSLGLGLARAEAAGGNPGIVPINARAHGKTYSELGAAWWQWAFQTPTPENVFAGADCSSAQTDHVWFLAGSFDNTPVTRTCNVPTGTFLFVPLANDFYGASPFDPPEKRTVDYVRSVVACVEGAVLNVTIDGVPVNDPNQYLEESPVFTIHFPEDNIAGLPPGDPNIFLDVCVDKGYYLYLNPMPPGPHTIHFTTAPGDSCAFAQDVTYNLTVGR
jgi:hypothetical protein